MTDVGYEIAVAKEEAAKEAAAEALAKGLAKGADEKTRELAKRMLEEGDPIDKVARITKLSEAEIRAL